jgi:hypothetical protein
MKVNITVAGDRDVAARLDALTGEVGGAIRDIVERETAALYAAVQPPVRTGRVAAAKRMRIITTGESVTGSVYFEGSGALKAQIGALEYGTRGKKKPVTRHARRLTHLFGRPIAPMQVIVDKYNRTPRIAEHRFLRGPFQQRRAAILAEMQRAINDAVK